MSRMKSKIFLPRMGTEETRKGIFTGLTGWAGWLAVQARLIKVGGRAFILRNKNSEDVHLSLPSPRRRGDAERVLLRSPMVERCGGGRYRQSSLFKVNQG